MDAYLHTLNANWFLNSDSENFVFLEIHISIRLIYLFRYLKKMLESEPNGILEDNPLMVKNNNILFF